MKKSILFCVICLLLILSMCVGMTACKEASPQTNTTGNSAVSTEPTEPQETEPEETVSQEWTGFSAACFTNGLTDFEGEIDGISFKGVLLKSNNYQPGTNFTKAAMKSLRIYARENGYNGLRVHAYVNQSDNVFVVNGAWFENGKWSSTDIYLGDLTTKTQFWSQATRSTENYLWFEFINLPTINMTSFTGAVSPYVGTVGGEEFSGFVFRSADYQPMTHFTEDAVEDIKAYAEEKGFNALRVHAYAIQLDNGFVIGGQYYGLSKWEYKDFLISEMTAENMTFWSQSQGLTENYLRFEFVNSDNAVKPGPIAVADSGLTNTNPYFKSSAAFSATDYSGTIGGQNIKGIRLQSADYQPFFFFTQKAIDKIRAAASESGNNFLRIHSYAILQDNGFVVGGNWTAPLAWYTTEVAVDQLSTEYSLWSQSQGTTDVYLVFEMFRMDIPEKQGPISANFFEPVVKEDGTIYSVGFADYTGEAAGEIINGIKISSADYQPYFKFTADGLAQIKAYAEESGNNFLNVHTYASLYDNAFFIGGNFVGTEVWTTTQLAVDSLSEDMLFWSQSQGLTTIYMWFSWEHMDIPEGTIVDHTFFQPGNNDEYNDGNPYIVSFADYVGKVGDRVINGVHVSSTDYQAHFHFSEVGIEKIRAYAAENDVDTLRISAYAILYNNAFVLNNQIWLGEQWRSIDVDIASLTTEFDFWSQSEGIADIYLTFEFYKAEVINPASFTGKLNFESFEGEVGGKQITGIKATSNEYQPHFHFTQSGIDRIKAYAAENNVDTLRISAYAILYNNSFVLNNQIWLGEQWSSIDVDITSLTTEFDFFSGSESTTEVYLTFEFYKAAVINPASFTGKLNFENFEGEIGGRQIIGIKATSNEYQPHFHFTQSGIDRIKAYAAQNNVNTLRISAYAILYNNGFVLNNQVWLGEQWSSIDVDIASLTTEFDFFSGSESTTEVYLTFEFYKNEIITTESFGGVFGYENFTGIVGDKVISGIKLTGTGRQRDAFTAEAIEKIKTYAASAGYTELKIQVYVTLDNNAFTVFGQSVVKDQWNELTISIDSLTTSSRIQTTSTGNTEAYFVFEFQ